MTPAILSRKIHKWLSLFGGLQLALWTISGFYMVVMDLDFIHGDSLVRNLQVPLSAQPGHVSFTRVAQAYPQATEVSLRSLPDMPGAAYEVTVDGRKLLIDAADGRRISPLPASTIERLAQSYYAGHGQLARATLLEKDRPLEIQTRPLPLWRVDFDDWLETSFYLHPDTGELVTRRHRFWRWFDFLWMLHIMDYDERSDTNNGLLRAATALGLITVMSGAWLLYFSFRRRRPPAVTSPVQGSS